MLLTALIALSTVGQTSSVPFKLLMKTEVKSPRPESAVLIQTKRKAFDSLLLLSNDHPKPREIRSYDWKRTNVIFVFPGYVQQDAKITVKSIKRNGTKLKITLDSHRGLSAVAIYPVLILKVPKLPGDLEVSISDPNRI